jgi:hypothetical protein
MIHWQLYFNVSTFGCIWQVSLVDRGIYLILIKERWAKRTGQERCKVQIGFVELVNCCRCSLFHSLWN